MLNRGATHLRPLPPEATVLHGDIRDHLAALEVLGDLEFDAVVDWVAFTAEHVQADIELFRGRTGSSVHQFRVGVPDAPGAGAGHRVDAAPQSVLAVLTGQDRLRGSAGRGVPADRLSATIVRPSHTYDRTSIPFDGKWTALARMRAGREVVVHGDGTSLWTLTHSADFARGFVPLLGHPRTIGDAFHITSDDVLTWNQIAEALAAAAGATARLVHVPSDAIAAADAAWGAGLLGDKAHRWCSTTPSCAVWSPATGPRSRSSRAPVRSSAGTTRFNRQRADGRLDAVMRRASSPPTAFRLEF